MSGDEAAQDAANSAKAAKDALDKVKNSIGQGGDPSEDLDKMKRAEDAAKRAEDAAKRAKDCADKGDAEGARKAAKEARDAAKEADDIANNKDGNNQGSGGKKAGNEKGDKPIGKETTLEELEKNKERAEKIIKKWQNKIAGDFGKFTAKCKASKEKKKNGLKVEVYQGNVSWNQQMNKAVNAFVKKMVFQKKREYESTYSRFKRGSGYVEYGQFIMPGEKEKENGLIIDTAFYIDRSGSMTSHINNVFKACLMIGEALKKNFRKEKVVSKILFEIFSDNSSAIPNNFAHLSGLKSIFSMSNITYCSTV